MPRDGVVEVLGAPLDRIEVTDPKGADLAVAFPHPLDQPTGDLADRPFAGGHRGERLRPRQLPRWPAPEPREPSEPS